MPQRPYEQLLLERAHSRRRWENQYAEGASLRDIDREKVFPQCELRMARFKGPDKTDSLDQRQIRGSAFQFLEEALLLCQRHLPLPGRIEPGRLERVDRALLPPEALREILVNALIHRDDTTASGAVVLALFDDRLKIWSAGRLPAGITPDDLSGAHDLMPRHPIIAEVSYRAALSQHWGRGTNRVIAHGLDATIAPLEFREVAGSPLVTFQVQVELTSQVTPQVVILLEAARLLYPRPHRGVVLVARCVDDSHKVCYDSSSHACSSWESQEECWLCRANNLRLQTATTREYVLELSMSALRERWKPAVRGKFWPSRSRVASTSSGKRC